MQLSGDMVLRLRDEYCFSPLERTVDHVHAESQCYRAVLPLFKQDRHHFCGHHVSSPVASDIVTLVASGQKPIEVPILIINKQSAMLSTYVGVQIGLGCCFAMMRGFGCRSGILYSSLDC
jgi:hypothetical protein